MGDEDPKSKCKEVSGTKTQLKLQRNWNYSGKTKINGASGIKLKIPAELKAELEKD